MSAGAHRDTNTHTHTHTTLKTQTNTCQVMIENPSFVLKGGNTIAYPHKHTHQGTHVICDMFWKASGCTDVIPFDERSSVPACVGQEPVRTSGAPSYSPLKVQLPKATVHIWDWTTPLPLPAVLVQVVKAPLPVHSSRFPPRLTYLWGGGTTWCVLESVCVYK